MNPIGKAAVLLGLILGSAFAPTATSAQQQNQPLPPLLLPRMVLPPPAPDSNGAAKTIPGIEDQALRACLSQKAKLQKQIQALNAQIKELTGKLGAATKVGCMNEQLLRTADGEIVDCYLGGYICWGGKGYPACATSCASGGSAQCAPGYVCDPRTTPSTCVRAPSGEECD